MSWIGEPHISIQKKALFTHKTEDTIQSKNDSGIKIPQLAILTYPLFNQPVNRFEHLISRRQNREGVAILRIY